MTEFFTGLLVITIMLTGIGLSALCYATTGLRWPIRILVALAANVVFGLICWKLFSAPQYPALPNVILWTVSSMGIGVVPWLLFRRSLEKFLAGTSSAYGQL